MKKPKTRNVGTRLLFGFSAMIAILCFVGVIGYFSTRNMYTQLKAMFAQRLPVIEHLIQIDRDLHQLLVAERSMIFSSVGSDVFKEFVQAFEENLIQSQERWDKLKSIPASDREKQSMAQYEKTREEWMPLSRKVANGRISDTREGRTEAIDLTLGLAKKKFDEMRKYLDELTEINLSLAKDADREADRPYRKALIGIFGSIALGLATGIVLMWALGRRITRPLRRVIDGLSEASGKVASASIQVSSASQQLSEGSSEQAASLEESSGSLEELSSMTRQNASNAGQANQQMKEARQIVDQANQAMENLTVSMAEISKASEETSKIIKTIDEIAFQTNLLALNAAVEAARAGEAGTGFAVVADEVRNLAMRAAEAAKNTAALIETTVKRVQGGSDLVARTNDTFHKVAESVRRVAELVHEIASASKEQSRGIEQIARAVSEMDKVVQNNAATAEENGGASEEMNAQAEQMNAFVTELTLLVGGNGTGKNGKKKTGSAGGKALSLFEADGNPEKKPVIRTRTKISQNIQSHRDAEADPARVIPLADEELREF